MPSKYIGYGLYLYFLSLPIGTSKKALAQFVEKRCLVAKKWKCIPNLNPKKLLEKGKEYYIYNR
jgi:hypothetical protein